MIVAVRTMGKVQVSADHIVHMISMWNGLVATVRAMPMASLMPFAAMRGGAGRGILAGDRECMLVDVVTVEMVQVAVVQVVGMAVMRDRLVAAACRVTVGMIVMNRVGAHRGPPSVKVEERLKML
jgi:hypothetical protein